MIGVQRNVFENVSSYFLSEEDQKLRTSYFLFKSSKKPRRTEQLFGRNFGVYHIIFDLQEAVISTIKRSCCSVAERRFNYLCKILAVNFPSISCKDARITFQDSTTCRIHLVTYENVFRKRVCCMYIAVSRIGILLCKISCIECTQVCNFQELTKYLQKYSKRIRKYLCRGSDE